MDINISVYIRRYMQIRNIYITRTTITRFSARLFGRFILGSFYAYSKHLYRVSSPIVRHNIFRVYKAQRFILGDCMRCKSYPKQILLTHGLILI